LTCALPIWDRLLNEVRLGVVVGEMLWCGCYDIRKFLQQYFRYPRMEFSAPAFEQCCVRGVPDKRMFELIDSVVWDFPYVNQFRIGRLAYGAL
jgi:hypothetical protein